MKLDKLLERIRKIAMNQFKFSSRDTKLFRKIVKQQKKDGYIDYEEIQYYFPGKSLDVIKKKYN